MAETDFTPEEIKVLGVRKSIIEERLNTYRRKVYGLTERDVQDLEEALENARAMEVRAQGRYEDDPENETKKAQLESIQARVQELEIAVREARENVGRPSVEQNSQDYYRMVDVIPELEEILANADPNLEYIPIEEIQRRLEVQRNLKAELEAAQRGGTSGLSDEEIRNLEDRIQELTLEVNRYALLIENEEQARVALERERDELTARIEEIKEALNNEGQEQGEDVTPLSDGERQELEDNLSGARSALNAERETHAAKLRELNELRRQRDEEIARINSEVIKTEVVPETIEDFRNQAEDALNEYAKANGIDPSELEIERTEIEDFDDGPKNAFKIVRVTKVNEPVLTTDERSEIENEIAELQNRLTEIGNEQDNDLDRLKLVLNRAFLKDNLKAEIDDYKQRIRINNELYAGTRDEENNELEARIKDVEARLAAIDNLTVDQILAEIDLQVIYLRDSVVRNNETYANSERRHEANEALRARRDSLELMKKGIIEEKENRASQENDVDLEKIKAAFKENLQAEINDYKQRIRINNELYAGTRDDENKDLEAKIKDVEARLGAVDGLTVEQMLAEIELQTTYFRDSVVRNNETYANSERRHEANEALRAKAKVLEGFKVEIAEARANRASQENDIDFDNIKAVFKDNLQAEINDYKRRIRINNELYAGTRDEENRNLEAKGKDVEARLAAVDGLTVEQMLAEIELQITYLNDSIVRNNETYANSERRHEANEVLRAKIKVLEGFKLELAKSKNKNNSQERAEIEERIAKLKEKLSKDDALRAKYSKLRDLDILIGDREEELAEIERGIKELEAEVANYEEQLAEDDKARQPKKELDPAEREKLEAELREKQERLDKVNEALENPDKAKAYLIAEQERINLIIARFRDDIEKARGQRGQEGVDNSEAIRIAENKIKELEELEKLKEEFIVKKDPVTKGDPIPIPPIPPIEPKLDDDKIKNEYLRRKHDMYAKYYGDKDYQAEYDERAARYREHERETRTEDNIAYRTVEDYPERLEDEQFLLLEEYKEALERMTMDEAGIDVYTGTPEQIEAQRAKDREYVETRNHTFDQHKYTQRDLATLGKYGEKMPYIPKQDGLIKNVGRGLLNIGIFARNVVAPIYKFIGKTIAQPIHRLVTRGKDASPYRNNFYHRMVARREYFAEQGRLRDEQETRELQEQAEPGEEVKPVRHPVRNWAAARWNAIFKSKDGNEAVLNAGEHDIKQNIINQERSAALLRALEENRERMAKEIQELQEALDKNPNAPNAEEVKQAIQDRQAKIEKLALSIDDVRDSREETKQTDAVSDKTHAIARKEINTFRTTVIKGVVKGVMVKYVGPAIEKWMLEHSKIKGKEWIDGTTEEKWVEGTTEDKWIEPTTKQEWVDGTYGDKTVPVYGNDFPQGTPEELIAGRAGTSYTGWRTVSGGHRHPAPYTLTGNEKITGVWVDDGSTWGTGVSDVVGNTAPVFTDRLVDAGLMTPAGVFRNDVEWSEVLEICEMEGIDVDKVYVSIGDHHWAKAADVFGVEQVQVGEKIIKEFIPGHWETVDVPGFWDTVDIPGHWETVNVPGYWKEVIKDNPRIVPFINGGKVVARGALVADGIHDVAENLRNTHTDVPEHKPQPRHYDRVMGVEDIDVEGIFGEEEHPTSKYEYEQRRRNRDDDNEGER